MQIILKFKCAIKYEIIAGLIGNFIIKDLHSSNASVFKSVRQVDTYTCTICHTFYHGAVYLNLYIHVLLYSFIFTLIKSHML